PRVPIPFPKDVYEAIRQAYLVETETPESPHTVASPTLLPDITPPTCHAKESEDSDTPGARSTSSDSTAPLLPDHPLTHTSPTLVPLLRTTVRMARFRSSYESSSSSSPPDLPSSKHYQGTSELVEDDEEEDEEIEESLDSDSGSEDAENEGPTIKDEDPAAGDEGLAVRDEGLAVRDEGPDMRDKSLSLGGDEVVPEGQQLAAPVMEIAMGEPLGLGYGALRRREIALGEGRMPSVFESGSLPVSPAPSIVPTPILSPMISLTFPSSVASPATAKAEGLLTELGAQAWEDRVDTRMANMSRAGYDDHRLIHDMLVQQAALQHELQETRDRVTALKQERDRKER
ncbi:hypothetical protein Tco_1349676, partial [Tanacetum coccineum]